MNAVFGEAEGLESILYVQSQGGNLQAKSHYSPTVENKRETDRGEAMRTTNHAGGSTTTRLDQNSLLLMGSLDNK